MKDIYIKKEFIREITELGVYCAVSYLSNSINDTVMFNAEMVAYTLYGTMDIGRRQIDGIKKSISTLCLGGVFDLVEDYKGTYVLNNTFVVDGEAGNFIVFSLHELRSVYTIDMKNKDGLLQYYLFLLSTINYDKKCGWHPMDTIAYTLDIAKRDTIISYNNHLECANLIYVHRTNATIKDFDDNYARVNNTYGRYEDKHSVIKHAEEYLEKCNIKANEKVEKLNTRSISKNYNDFVKGSYNGDIEELKKDCLAYNEHYKNSAYAKLKDLTVFDEDAAKPVQEEEVENDPTTFTMDDIEEAFTGRVSRNDESDLYVGGTYREYIEEVATKSIDEVEDSIVDAMNAYYDREQEINSEANKKKRVYDAIEKRYSDLEWTLDATDKVEIDLLLLDIYDYKQVSMEEIIRTELKINKILAEY